MTRRTSTIIAILCIGFKAFAQNNLPQAIDRVESANGVPVWYIILLILTLVFALASLAGIYILYGRLTKIEKNAKADSKKVARLEGSLQDVSNALNTLKSKIQVAPIAKPTATTTSVPASPKPASETPRVVERKVEKGTIYVSAPSNGEFRNPEKTFVKGKSIFEINFTGDDGEFTIVEKPEAVSVARRSIAQLVEPACYVEGVNDGNFTRIVTIKPGTVKKVGSTWRIVQKAVVSLEK